MQCNVCLYSMIVYLGRYSDDRNSDSRELVKIIFSEHLKNLAENTDCQKVRVEKVVYFQFKSSSNES